MTIRKITEKYQTTLPLEVRKFLDIHPGDRVGFEIDNGKVTLKKVTPLDFEFTQALEGTLIEWNSKEDDEAYNDL